jgi:hypothetical protein
MKPIFRRLQMLERASMVTEYVPDENSPAAILRARRLRRLGEDGSSPTSIRPPVKYYPGMSLADILRQERFRARTHYVTPDQPGGGIDAA